MTFFSYKFFIWASLPPSATPYCFNSAVGISCGIRGRIIVELSVYKEIMAQSKYFSGMIFLLKKNTENQDVNQSPTKFKGKGRGKVQRRTGHKSPDGE